ncbi:unnamed protein product [Microthlaspi erraticum]|uniref:Uncharacterized protein n=1 Tax=Microthlaspi erraticum TaxID=1685480 RepID=A0A6D2HNC2_9BRAS|nr:unnamed protein product [Microthlaspi erraticum]
MRAQRCLLPRGTLKSCAWKSHASAEVKRCRNFESSTAPAIIAVRRSRRETIPSHRLKKCSSQFLSPSTTPSVRVPGEGEREVSAMSLNPSNGGIDDQKEKKPKVFVIMGPTGSGKSKLAVDLASQFPVEIINADAMQIYSGLDVLTNKVPTNEQKGVPHHLLGTVSPDTEFTSKDFRDNTIPLIEEILSRNHIPVLVGGTNYYIQAVVSKFLLDDSAEEDTEECCSNVTTPEGLNVESICEGDDFSRGYDLLKELDPVAANRIHPNNHRKINQYLSLHARRGVLPSKLFQGENAENWGRIDASRYDYCLICMDAETSVLDRYVGERVDSMVDAGLLDELYDIYKPGADYTRGLRQSIGVREFEDFLKMYLSDGGESKDDDKFMKEDMKKILSFSKDDTLRIMLEEAIEKVKLNTRRLLRRQKRRVNRLETVFGWNIHHIDATECLLNKSEESWDAKVVKPATEIIRCFLEAETEFGHDSTSGKLIERDLWSQYVCEACGNKVLRGRHEWEHHSQGRAHRKRTTQHKKAQTFKSREKQEEEEEEVEKASIS